MVYQVIVLYPNENLEFDMDYYLLTHMPLVGKNWKPHGLQKWEITKFDKGPDGSAPKFAVKATLTYANAEAAQKALASEEAKEVFGDVPKFTNVQPVLLMGDVVGVDSY